MFGCLTGSGVSIRAELGIHSNTPTFLGSCNNIKYFCGKNHESSGELIAKQPELRLSS